MKFEYRIKNYNVDFATANYTGTTNWQEISGVGFISNQNEDVLRPARVKIEVSAGNIACFDEVIVEEL